MNNLTEKQLTERLMVENFCTGIGTPQKYKSLVSEKEYDYYEYKNHGKGGIYKNFLDLPENDYPYTLIYDYKIEKWKL